MTCTEQVLSQVQVCTKGNNGSITQDPGLHPLDGVVNWGRRSRDTTTVQCMLNLANSFHVNAIGHMEKRRSCQVRGAGDSMKLQPGKMACLVKVARFIRFAQHEM